MAIKAIFVGINKHSIPPYPSWAERAAMLRPCGHCSPIRSKA